MIKKFENPLIDIEEYTNHLTISKVIIFFKRKNIIFTKTMIQNYVRIGLLVKPDNNRYYKKTHMSILVLIYILKPFYSLGDIYKIISFNTQNFEEKFIYDFYIEFINLYNNLIDENEILQKNNLNILVIESIIMKNEVKNIISKL